MDESRDDRDTLPVNRMRESHRLSRNSTHHWQGPSQSRPSTFKRREYLAGAGFCGIVATAGCLGVFRADEDNDDSAEPADDTSGAEPDSDEAHDDEDADADASEDEGEASNEDDDESDDEREDDDEETVEAINDLIETELNPQLERVDDIDPIDDAQDDTIDSLTSAIFEQIVAEINHQSQEQIGDEIAGDVASPKEARDEADRIEAEYGETARHAADALTDTAALVEEIHAIADGEATGPEDELYPDEDTEIDRDQYDDPPEQPETEDRDSGDVEIEADTDVDLDTGVTVTGTVTNVSDEPIDAVDLRIEFYAAGNEYLGADLAGVEDLAVGESKEFKGGIPADELRGDPERVEIEPDVYDIVDAGED